MTDDEILKKAVVKAIELCESGKRSDHLLDAVCSSFTDQADRAACRRMEREILLRLNCPREIISGGMFVFKCPSSFGRTARDQQIAELKGQVDSMESELVKRNQQIADLKAKLDARE